MNKNSQMDEESVFIKELFDRLPDGWSGRRMKYIAEIKFSNVDKKSEDNEKEVLLCNYTDVYKNDFITGSIDFMKATASSEEIAKFGLRPNDVMITKDSETADDIGVPAIIGEDIANLVCGYHLSILRPGNEVLGRFLFRYLQSTRTASFFEKRANGITRFAIGMDAVGDCPVVFPSLQVQQSVTSFLDKETARIDALISKKERQIELLQEKSRAMITCAIAKGLNPNSRMKNSGIEWIGEIPKEWEVRRLKHIASLKSGDGITTEEFREDGEYPVYGGNGMRGYCQKYNHDGLFLLIGRQGALCGNINYARGKFWASEHAVVVSPTLPTAVIWLGEVLRSMNLNQYSISAAQPGLAVERIRELWIPFPTYPEQERMASRFEEELEKSQAMICKVRNSIGFLHELRSSLITAAVSGQIDLQAMKNRTGE